MYEARQNKEVASRIIGVQRKKSVKRILDMDKSKHISFQYGLMQCMQHPASIPVLQKEGDKEGGAPPESNSSNQKETKAKNAASALGIASASVDMGAGALTILTELYKHFVKNQRRRTIPNDTTKLTIGKCHGGFVDGGELGNDNIIKGCIATLELESIQVDKGFQEEGGFHYFCRTIGLPLLQIFSGGSSLASSLLHSNMASSIASGMASVGYMLGNLYGQVSSQTGMFDKFPELNPNAQVLPSSSQADETSPPVNTETQEGKTDTPVNTETQADLLREWLSKVQ